MIILIRHGQSEGNSESYLISALEKAIPSYVLSSCNAEFN